jgi:hypothetical protein
MDIFGIFYSLKKILKCKDKAIVEIKQLCAQKNTATPFF